METFATLKESSTETTPPFTRRKDGVWWPTSSLQGPDPDVADGDVTYKHLRL